MATPTVSPEGVVRRSSAAPLWDGVRWLTLSLFVVALVVTVLVGTRHDSYWRLQHGLDRGTVTQVRVEGALGGDYEVGAEGLRVVRLVWRDGWHRSAAQVVQATSQSQLQQQHSLSASATSAEIVGSLDAALRELAPDVQVTWAAGRTDSATVAGWDLPDGWVVLHGIVLLLVLCLLVNGPEPRWATRWAWFWLLLSPLTVLAVPAYLLSGPHVGNRRLTGGWAFVVAFLVIGGAAGR